LLPNVLPPTQGQQYQEHMFPWISMNEYRNDWERKYRA
jgi:hypothetical protein